MAETTLYHNSFHLPGFRFHPTEEELLDFYLKRMVCGKRLHSNVIGFLNIYHHEPWDLPGLAKIGEREWYFIVPRERKQGTGGRPSRTTEKGFWKATGSDRRILSFSDPKRVVGLRKTLVFYRGRAPKGTKTDWIMNEYRLPDNSPSPKEMVLCKIYMKATSLKVLEQRAAMEERVKEFTFIPFIFSISGRGHLLHSCRKDLKIEREEVLAAMEEERKEREESSISLQMPAEMENMTELEVSKWSPDWTHDPYWSQMASPWLQTMTPNYANILHF